MTLNLCQAGHTFHESKLVDTQYGPFHIWDWEQYMDFPGYCTGQDEVSKSIDLAGVWERNDTSFMVKVLDDQPGRVLDFGAHIGWYAALAEKRKCEIVTVEADPDNDWLMGKNIHQPVYPNRLWERWVCWATDVPPLAFDFDHVRVMKVDIEGHEHEALSLTRKLWQERRVDYGLWELSPIFEQREGIMAQSYAELVDEIAGYGYRWFILKDEGPWYITGADLTFPQENAFCEKLP